MPFYQNVFNSDFIGVLVLGDRQHCPSFKCRQNSGRGQDMCIAWTEGPYNLSGNDTEGDSRANLTIQVAIDTEFKKWISVTVNIASGAASSSAVTPEEIVIALNNNATFASWLTASCTGKFNSGKSRLMITKQLKPSQSNNVKFYIQNGTAEEAIRFNGRAGVDELPEFFSKHTIANRWTYTDSIGLLIELDPSNTVDAAVINNAVDAQGISLGYSSGTVRADWEILRGKSGIFNFQKITVDGSDRITEIIEYPAGALAGDLARKIEYAYTGANLKPSQITEIPHVLLSGDLVTP